LFTTHNDEYLHRLSNGFFQHDRKRYLVDKSPMSVTMEIYARIIEKLGESGETPRSLSLRATGQPDAVTSIRRGHMPNSERLRAIADAMGTEVSWLLTGKSEQTPGIIDGRLLFRDNNAPRDLPIYGTALGADLEIDGNGNAHDVEVTNIQANEIVGFFRRPPGLMAQSKAYALYVVGSSMEPRFDPGQPVFVDAARPPSIGDDVIVQLVDLDEERVTTALIKRLVRRTSAFVELEQYNPARKFRIQTTRIASIQRVLTVTELLGL
jgi:phage repressor protein C with HTH and peptisase S24 domain